MTPRCSIETKGSSHKAFLVNGVHSNIKSLDEIFQDIDGERQILDMNIQRYYYIKKVAVLGSIAKAAENLYVSPSAISQCIALEEKEHQITIFDRHTKPMKLTHQGSIYLNCVEELLHCYKNMEDRLRKDSLYAQDFVLTIALSSVLVTDFFFTITPAFQEKYPHARFRIICSNTSGVEALLLNREIDYAISGFASNSNKITNIELTSYPPAILAAPPNHPIVEQHKNKTEWKDRPIIDLREIQHENFILAPPGDNLRNLANLLFKYYNINPVEKIQISQSFSIQQLVQQGYGFGFINAHRAVIGKESPTNYFHLNSSILPAQRKLYLQYHYKEQLSEPAKYTIHLFKQYYSDR